jgi:hypothetical protein
VVLAFREVVDLRKLWRNVIVSRRRGYGRERRTESFESYTQLKTMWANLD